MRTIARSQRRRRRFWRLRTGANVDHVRSHAAYLPDLAGRRISLATFTTTHRNINHVTNAPGHRVHPYAIAYIHIYAECNECSEHRCAHCITACLYLRRLSAFRNFVHAFSCQNVIIRTTVESVCACDYSVAVA